MAESSSPWSGIITGDAGPYSDELWADIWRKLFVVDRTTQGVIRGYENELEVTGASSPIAVATGAGVDDGKFYENDTPVSVAIPTPVGATRIDRIVLRKSWAAQTVRITRIAGAEGGGSPAITQSDGVTWDIPLAEVSITTGGAITLTDQRKYLLTPLLSTLATAVGQIPYVSEANQLAMLAMGTALQVVRVNAAATGLEYADSSVPVVALTNVRRYTSSTTWTKPVDLYGVIVEVVGGGGGGGGATSGASAAAAGGGGGGGGYAKKFVLAAALGATEAVTVGAGGTAGSTAGGNGGTGGTSSFGTHCSATGGEGGNGGTSGTAPKAIAAGGGGIGSNGNVGSKGGGGGAGARLSGDEALSGAGGNSVLGGGGDGQSAANAGQAGGAYGGGGSGAAASANFDLAGGAGGAGVVFVYEYTYI